MCKTTVLRLHPNPPGTLGESARQDPGMDLGTSSLCTLSLCMCGHLQTRLTRKGLRSLNLYICGHLRARLTRKGLSVLAPASTPDPEGPVPLEPVPLLAPVSTPHPEGPMHLEPAHVRAPASTPDPEGPVHLEPVHLQAPASTPDPEGLCTLSLCGHLQARLTRKGQCTLSLCFCWHLQARLTRRGLCTLSLCMCRHLQPRLPRAGLCTSSLCMCGHLVARLVLARGRGNCTSALHCCKELIRCTGGRGRLAAGCRAVIRINRQRAGVSHTVSSTALTHAVAGIATQQAAQPPHANWMHQRPNLCCVLALTSRQRPAQCAKHSLAFSLLLTKGSAQTNKHPPSPSTTANQQQSAHVRVPGGKARTS